VPVFGVAKFEHFFRAAAELDVDKNDLRRYSDFVERKLYDLLLIGQATAGANARDIVEPWDLPVTKGCRTACTRSASSTKRSSWSRSSAG
jgi:hypothetical protein